MANPDFVKRVPGVPFARAAQQVVSDSVIWVFAATGTCVAPMVRGRSRWLRAWPARAPSRSSVVTRRRKSSTPQSGLHILIIMHESGNLGLPFRLLNRRAVARILGLSSETVRRMVARGELPAVRVAGRLRFDPHELKLRLRDAR